jgi:pimeloyl-ACP methyl ester carboxylesterase
VELAVHHLGGHGPGLLVCHATGFHGLAYAPMARDLARVADVWALDFRGHGSSTPPRSGDFTWDGMADDVLAAVDAIGTGPVLAVGHSLGGAAILLAELDRPGSITRAYLYEPIVFPREHVLGRAESPMSGPARNRRDVFPSKRAAFERYASRPPLDALRPDALAAYVEHGFVGTGTGEVRLACRPEHEARTFEAEDRMTLDRLADLDLPVVIGVGARAPHPGPADLAPAVAAAVRGSRLIEYADLGHFGPLQDPDRIAADVAATLLGDEPTAADR